MADADLKVGRIARRRLKTSGWEPGMTEWSYKTYPKTRPIKDLMEKKLPEKNYPYMKKKKIKPSEGK